MTLREAKVVLSKCEPLDDEKAEAIATVMVSIATSLETISSSLKSLADQHGA